MGEALKEIQSLSALQRDAARFGYEAGWRAAIEAAAKEVELPMQSFTEILDFDTLQEAARIIRALPMPEKIDEA